MSAEAYYAILAFVVVGMNIAPGFMPPTWMILAFFYLQFNLSLLPLVIIGAIFATLGRTVLYLLSKNYLRRLFPSEIVENYGVIGKFFKKNNKLTAPLVLTYAFLPIPSNQVFIMAGLAGLKIEIIAGSFLAGRLISYSFWVSVASQVTNRLEGIFQSHISQGGVIAAEVLGFALIIIIGKINWKKVLKMEKEIHLLPS